MTEASICVYITDPQHFGACPPPKVRIVLRWLAVAIFWLRLTKSDSNAPFECMSPNAWGENSFKLWFHINKLRMNLFRSSRDEFIPHWEPVMCMVMTLTSTFLHQREILSDATNQLHVSCLEMDKQMQKSTASGFLHSQLVLVHRQNSRNNELVIKYVFLLPNIRPGKNTLKNLQFYNFSEALMALPVFKQETLDARYVIMCSGLFEDHVKHFDTSLNENVSFAVWPAPFSPKRNVGDGNVSFGTQ